MTWDISEIHQISDHQLARMIRQSALPICDFFPDTSFLRAPLSRLVWEALLEKSVRITRGVVFELANWASSPNSNIKANRDIVDTVVRGSSSAINPIQLRDFTEPLQKAFWYYFRLLMLRKLRGKQFAIEFEKSHGRPPTAQEFYPLFKRWRPGLEDMSARIAWKGFQDYGKPNYGVDEALITLAALHAIQTGRETIVLTRDHDLQVQFYKLIYLIDTHYRGLFAAEFYYTNEVVFQKTRIAEMVTVHPLFSGCTL